MKLERINRVSVAESVSERLVALITEGHIKPGERLPSEQELMEQLGVGRSSVREALRGLALVGIVEARPRRGTIVVSPMATSFGSNLRKSLTYTALKDLFEVRLLLEGFAAARAAKAATEQDLDAIALSAAVVERKIRAGGSYFSENAEFHLTIAEASHNPVLVNCLASLIGTLRDVRERADMVQHDGPKQDADDHRAIVEALRLRQSSKAKRLMERHILRTLRGLEPKLAAKPTRKKPTRNTRALDGIEA